MKRGKLAVTTPRQNWGIRQQLAHNVQFVGDLWHFRHEVLETPKTHRANGSIPRGNIPAATLTYRERTVAESDPKPATWIFHHQAFAFLGRGSARPEWRRLHLSPASCERSMIVSGM